MVREEKVCVVSRAWVGFTPYDAAPIRPSAAVTKQCRVKRPDHENSLLLSPSQVTFNQALDGNAQR